MTEITAASDKSFEHAIEQGIKRANKTLDNVTGAWVQEMKVDVDGRDHGVAREHEGDVCAEGLRAGVRLRAHPAPSPEGRGGRQTPPSCFA
ncbi:MAG: dodecin family protein [Phycisphaerales bacterium]